MNDFIVADTETTGFSPKTDRIIEFGAAKFDPVTGALGETLHLYINPGIAIPAAATEIHGIRNEDLADKPKFAEVAARIEAFMKGNILVAHNASFDVNFLKAEFKNAKRKDFEDLPSRVICTRKLARSVNPRSSASLDALCDTYGVDRSSRTFHGALVDCFLLAQVYPHLAKLAKERDQVLSGLLGFQPGLELPEDLVFLGRAYVAMNETISRIKAEQERFREKIEQLAGGKEIEDPDFTVSYSPRTTTDWKKVKADKLSGVDLSSYEKTSFSMTVAGT